MAKDPPVCKKCGEAHWPFHGCPKPEPTAPAEVAWPAPPEGYREAQGFGDEPDELARSLAKAGFGAPGNAGFLNPSRRS